MVPAELLGDLGLNVQVGPLGLPIPGLGAAVANLLAAETAPIDQLAVEGYIVVARGRRPVVATRKAPCWARWFPK